MNRLEIYTHPNFPGKHLVSAGNGGFGDTIHDSMEDAQRYVNITRMNEESHKAREDERIRKQQDEEAMESNRLRLVNLYLSDSLATSMEKGRIIKTLSVRMRYSFGDDKIVLHRHEAIERRVQDGWQFKSYSFGEKFSSQDDCFGELTKTEENYARWLLNNKNVIGDETCKTLLTHAS